MHAQVDKDENTQPEVGVLMTNSQHRVFSAQRCGTKYGQTSRNLDFSQGTPNCGHSGSLTHIPFLSKEKIGFGIVKRARNAENVKAKKAQGNTCVHLAIALVRTCEWINDVQPSGGHQRTVLMADCYRTVGFLHLLQTDHYCAIHKTNLIHRSMVPLKRR